MNRCVLPHGLVSNLNSIESKIQFVIFFPRYQLALRILIAYLWKKSNLIQQTEEAAIFNMLLDHILNITHFTDYTTSKLLIHSLTIKIRLFCLPTLKIDVL
jgi:hypothetical protein